VVKTVLLTTIKEPGLDSILASLLQVEEQLSIEEEVSIYMARLIGSHMQGSQGLQQAGRTQLAAKV